jgi:hypothetical protein
MSVRAAKTLAKSLLHKLFVGTQRLGLSVLPVHFYSSIPDIHDLRRRRDWMAPRSMHGISALSEGEQSRGCARCFRRCRQATQRIQLPFRVAGPMDMARSKQTCWPHSSRAVSLGASYRSVAASAPRSFDAARLAGYRPEVICIDPYPTAFLARCAADGTIELIAQKAQDVPMRRMTNLDRGGPPVCRQHAHRETMKRDEPNHSRSHAAPGVRRSRALSRHLFSARLRATFCPATCSFLVKARCSMHSCSITRCTASSCA